MSMRWALRNQEKIKAHFEPFGQDVLNEIKRSLDTFFKGCKQGDVEKLSEQIKGEPYPILMIPYTGNSSADVLFYVVRKTYDVYLLAFKEIVG